MKTKPNLALSPEEFEKGETARLIIALEWSEPADRPAPPLDFEFPDPPAAEGLTLFANSFKSMTELSGSTVHVKRTYTYEFTADREGATQIGAVAVNAFRLGSTDRQPLKTQSLPLTVTRAAIKPGKLLRHPAVLAGGAALLAAVAAALAWPWFKARRKTEEAAAPEKSIHDLARERLREAERLRMAGEYDRFLAALAQEMSRYLDQGLGIRRSLSGERLAAAVSDRLGEPWPERMLEFERLCDRVRFAGHGPDRKELDAAMTTMMELIREGESKQTLGPGPDLAADSRTPAKK